MAITQFKGIQGHRFWYQLKAHLRLPIMIILTYLLSCTVSNLCLIICQRQQQPGTMYSRRLPETDGAKVLLTSDQVGLYTSQALTRWRHLARIRKSGLLLIYRPRTEG